MALDFIGGAAGGAAEGLESVLKRLFLEQQQRQQAELARESMDVQRRGQGVTMRGQDLSKATADARLGLDEKKFGQDVTEFEAGAPQRMATLKLTGAQSSNLERQPAKEEADRAHDQFMGGLEHKFRLGEIGAQGAQAQATARIRTRPRISKVASVDDDGKAVTKFIDIDSGEVVHEEKAAPTADERNRGAAGGRAMPVVQRAGELSQLINTKYGPEAKALGALRALQSKANLDPDVAEYLSVVEGFTPLIARAAGHVGVLTEQDVERTIQLLPKPGDSADLAKRKLANLDRMLGGGGGAPAPGGGVKVKSIQEIK